MKVIEARQTAEDIVILSWSPKMDLLAIGNSKCEIALHRLSWQRVWTTGFLDKKMSALTEIPVIMTWHPEGIFIAVVTSSRRTISILDVEGGGLVHTHEISYKISSLNWCLSDYDLPMSEIFNSQPRHQHQLKNDLKLTRLESKLSILLVGTLRGVVFSYTGGFLFITCTKVPGKGKSEIIQVDSRPDLRSFQYIVDQIKESEVTFAFTHVENRVFPRLAPIVGPMGFKYFFFLKNWTLVQSELSGINEQWAKIGEIYKLYLTYGGDRISKDVFADYLDLLLTGALEVELELFLGSNGREKEAKKKLNSLSAAATAITDHLRTTKCALVFMISDLNEINGFLKQISKSKDGRGTGLCLHKSLCYLYLAALELQSLTHTFIDVFKHFMHLIINTIHSINTHEAPDFIEEDSETEKVIRFLRYKYNPSVWHFLLRYRAMGVKRAGPKNPRPSRGSRLHKLTKATFMTNLSKMKKIARRASTGDKVSSPPGSIRRKLSFASQEIKTGFENIKEPIEPLEKWKDFNQLYLFLENRGKKKKNHNILLDFHRIRVKRLLSNIIPRMSLLIEDLLIIPALSSMRSEAHTYPLVNIPIEDHTSIMQGESKGRHTGFLLSKTENVTYVYLKWDAESTYLFEINFSEKDLPRIKSTRLAFSRNIVSLHFFTDSYLTLLSYDSEEKRADQEFGRTIICQVPLPQTVSLGKEVALSSEGQNIPNTITIMIPLDVFKPGPTNSPYIDYILPIDNFCPKKLAVSGARKVGALSADDNRSLLLLDMEHDLSDSSLEDDGDDE